MLPLAGGAAARTTGTPVARADLALNLGIIAKAKVVALTCDGFEPNEARCAPRRAACLSPTSR